MGTSSSRFRLGGRWNCNQCTGPSISNRWRRGRFFRTCGTSDPDEDWLVSRIDVPKVRRQGGYKFGDLGVSEGRFVNVGRGGQSGRLRLGTLLIRTRPLTSHRHPCQIRRRLSRRRQLGTERAGSSCRLGSKRTR